MLNPVVTIVTPSYNQGQFIRATIESVLSQDYPGIEYIIMDGGSTDETASIVKEYSSRLTFISEKDRGQSDAINKGFHMAKGEILAWLNSDDLYLPGAVSAAVEAFDGNPSAGAVYGEGYLIDREGRTTCRFPHTMPLDLWRLVYLSDYILQQTVFFRKTALDEVGYLNESLHYAMDWDILIRLALNFPLVYLPVDMGCLREYPEAKSFAGGQRRIQEIGEMLRGHTGLRTPPGYILYGAETRHRIWCAKADSILAPAPLQPLSRAVQSLIRFGAAKVVNRVLQRSQGLYTDGWATKRLQYVVPPGPGPLLVEGRMPFGWQLGGQHLQVRANGVDLGRQPVPLGDFRLAFDLPPELRRRALHLEIRAARSKILSLAAADLRRAAYLFSAVRHADNAPA